MSIVICPRCFRAIDTDYKEVFEVNHKFYVGGIENDACESDVCEDCLTEDEYDAIQENMGEKK